MHFIKKKTFKIAICLFSISHHKICLIIYCFHTRLNIISSNMTCRVNFSFTYIFIVTSFIIKYF